MCICVCVCVCWWRKRWWDTTGNWFIHLFIKTTKFEVMKSSCLYKTSAKSETPLVKGWEYHLRKNYTVSRTHFIASLPFFFFLISVDYCISTTKLTYAYTFSNIKLYPSLMRISYNSIFFLFLNKVDCVQIIPYK